MSLIAIIDDDPDILDAGTILLTSKGHKVITANNFTSGLEIVINQNPDLIILDILMEKSDDGFNLAQKIREQNTDTPILIYTSVSKSTGMDFLNNPSCQVKKRVFEKSDSLSKIEKVKKKIKREGTDGSSNNNNILCNR